MSAQTTRLATALMLAATLSASAVHAQPAAAWGMVFPTSERGEAHQEFLEGVTAMHLHLFEDAEEHFQAAQHARPGFAMAYWGEALTQYHPIWQGYYNRDKAVAILKRLGASPAARAAKAPTAREKDYLAAVEVLFGEGPQRERETAYSRAMGDLAAKYPDDVEARALYCLSLFRVTLPGLTRDQTDMAMASLAFQVLRTNPRHPGANRYLIQATDDAIHAPLGWIAVENLRQVYATAAEALHIPSHVYMNYGMWPEVADANMRAFDSSMAWVKAHGWKLQDLNVHNYGHLLQYAHYAYLQSGALAKAAAVRERVTSDYEASGKARELRRWYADVYARRLVELARWDEAKELADRARGDRLTDQALWHAIGLGAVRSGQLDLAREALAIVIKGEGGATSLPARELSGMLHLAEGQTEGMKELADAAEVDSRNLLRIGMPPTLIKPAMELYGEVLLEHGRAEDALKQFERGLVIFRRRPLMLLGAARASQRLGRTATASQYYRQLSEIWASADADHPFASEARQLSPSR